MGWLTAATLAALMLLTLAGCGTTNDTTPAPPAKPTNVTATAGDTQASISWSAVSGATSYNIYYGTTAGVTTATGTKVANVTSPQVVSPLLDGTTYFFVVTAVNAAGESALSSEVTATPEPPAPTAPTGVQATAGDTQATVSWTAVNGATSYNIYYGTAAGVTIANGTKSPNATSPQTITGLLDGTPYYLVVTAVNAGGESAVSTEVTVTPITKPSGIVVSAENSQAKVAWLSALGATSYNLYYGTTNPLTIANSSGKISVSASAGTSNNTLYFQQPVTLLTNGTTYYFAVTAVNAGGETGLSSQKSAKPSATVTPGSPAAVTVSSTATGQVQVVWGDYVPDATSYNAYYLQASSAPTTATVISTGTKVALTTASPQTLTTGFTSGLTYWFVVTSVNGSVESGGQTNPKSVIVQ